MSLVLQERDERVRSLTNLGKEPGYVFYDEVNDIHLNLKEKVASMLKTLTARTDVSYSREKNEKPLCW